MTSFNKRIIILISIFSISFNGILNAQEMVGDSIINDQKRTVNVAYGEQPEWLVSSSVSSVEGSKLQKSFTSNLANTLFGRLKGLTVVQNGTGEPGQDSPSLYSRGLNTYGPGTGLLIIVDGFESTFEQLVPEEIETVCLLKDASATAIYGTRGANGVLLVTTKRGTLDRMAVNFSTQVGFQQAVDLPEFLGSYDYASLYNEGLTNDGEPAKYTQSDLEAYRTGNDPYFHPDINWYDQVLRSSAPMANYNLNFRGGNEGIRYFVSINALNREGLFKKTADDSEFSFNSRYSRYNLITNFDIRITKRFTANFTSGASVEEKPWAAANTSGSIFNTMARITPNSFPVYNPNLTYGGSSLYSNPLGDILENGLYNTYTKNYKVSLKLNHDLDMIAKGLSISVAGSLNDYSTGYNNRTRTYERFALSKNDLGDIIYNKFGQNTSLSGSTGGQAISRTVILQAFLNYYRSFDQHLIDAMLMANTDNRSASGLDFPYKHNNLGGRFTYSYDKKYIGEFSFSYMGSESFPKDKRYGLFPALSLGWIISDEEFMKGNNIINFLKVRGSYGLVGNEKISSTRFIYQQTFPGSTYYFGTSNSSFRQYTLGPLANSEVTWEKEKKMNLGFEATMLQRLGLSVDIFNQDRFDIVSLPYSTVPQYLGLNLPYDNVGKVNNKGFEATLSYHSDPAKDLQIFIDADVWYAKNKIIYNAELLQPFDYLYRTGHSVNQPFLLEAMGFFKDQSDIDSSPAQTFSIVRPGDLKYKDQNNDKIIDANDYVPIGKTGIPELSAGLTAGLKFKGFDLEAFFQGVSGRTIYLSGYYFQAFQNNGKVSPIALGRWTQSTASTATYPRLSASNNLNNYQSSSFWQRNGDFIKLRNLELGYCLPDELIHRINLEMVRFFINGTNLLSIDHLNDYGIDPEASIVSYPNTRIYSLGIRLQF